MKRMNKKGLEFKLLTYAVVAFSLIIIASAVIVNRWNETYELNISEDLGTFDKLNSMSDTSDIIKGKLTPTDTSAGEDNPETGTFRGAYGVIGTIFTTFVIVFGEGGIIGSIIERFGLPMYIYRFLIVIIIGAISWALVSIIFRLTGRTA